MKNLTIKTTVNFGGFYNSIHSYLIDDNIDLMEYDYQNVDYKTTFKNYSKDYIKVLNNILDTNIIFKNLVSPTYYNYSTDSIDVEITKKDILKLFKYIKEEELKEEVINIIKKSSNSRDGYIAFYSYKDFFKKDNLDILVECLLDVIVEHLRDDIVKEIQSNYLEIVFNENN